MTKIGLYALLFTVPHLPIPQVESFSVGWKQGPRISTEHGHQQILSAKPPAGNDDNDATPSMDWLTESLASIDGMGSSSESDTDSDSPYIEQIDADDVMRDAPIPSTGISVADEMEKSDVDQFNTDLVPIKGLPTHVRAAQLVTTATFGSFEPVRYIVAMGRGDAGVGKTNTRTDYVMIDIPPYSDELAGEMRRYIGKGGSLSSILVTSKDAIHYNDSPAVYTFRRADVDKWTRAFPGVEIVAYRLDVPRDCRDFVTQRLDGYGPFAMDADNATFAETGRPLTYEEWDAETTDAFVTKGELPTTDANDETQAEDEDKEDPYSPENIRASEEGKPILAVYTPGHSFGSMTYVFPDLELCFSGFTIPVEDTRGDSNSGIESAAPALDVRGYITTSKAGIARQTESARSLIETYVDRFQIVMPSRGDPLYLDGTTEEKKFGLMNIIDDYEKVGMIYEQLGITSPADDMM